MDNNKRTILTVSNFSAWSTGFGKHMKTLLSALYKTEKYNIIEYVAQINDNDPQLKRTAWVSRGSFSNEPDFIKIVNHLQANPTPENQHYLRMIGYGAYYIDKMVYEYKPDVILFVEDPWSFDSWVLDKPWAQHIPTVKHCPLDSLPLLPALKDNPSKWTNLWVKSKFALKPLEEAGISAKLVPGLIPLKSFYPLPDEEKKNLRKLIGIDEDTVVFGFVFRNQLRKLVVTLLEAYKIFQDNNPHIKSKLLLHSNFNEDPNHSWNIPAAIKELKIDNDSILTTYKCSFCNKSSIISFRGQKLSCLSCGQKETLNQVTIVNGVSEEEMNSIYNLLDAFLSPVTSGGCEFGIAEAMATGCVTSTVRYAFGETYIDSGYSIPMPFNFYREPNSLFLKAQPVAEELANIMKDIAENPIKYKEMGLRGREWALEYFDNDKIVQTVMDFVDNSTHNYDFKQPEQQKQPSLDDFLLQNGNKRLLVVNSENADSVYSMIPVLEELHKIYLDYDFYVSTRPEFFEILRHLSYIVNYIPFNPELENFRFTEGSSSHKGYFELTFWPNSLTTKCPTYHNGLDIIK